MASCPRRSSELTPEQRTFLEQSVAGLAQDGKVISVRLALFAEMVKGKPWTPATLKEVGGTQGVGVTFLDETFSATTAPPEHRLHQKAAQAVLKALLPQSGTDIKGQMRSEAELREASGYASRPRDFDDVIGILDSELRLITPTDPEGSAGEVPARQARRPALLSAHARLPRPLAARLADPQAARDPPGPRRAAAGRTRGDLGRQAGEPPPALGRGVGEHPDPDPPKDWTEPQRRMMRRAGRVHGLRAIGLAAADRRVGAAGVECWNRLWRPTSAKAAVEPRPELLTARHRPGSRDRPTIIGDTAAGPIPS